MPIVAALLASAALLPQIQAQNSYQIQTVSPAFVPAGANGATLLLNGNLPNYAQGGVQVCFYTGFGSTAPITPTPTNLGASITVPASTIQSIPAAQFTAANGYAFPALVYNVFSGNVCDGTFDSTFSNSVTVPIAEPLLAPANGPTNVPQTNSATTVQAAPYNVVLSGNYFTASTVVTFGTFGNVTSTLVSPSVLSIAVPAAFSSSPVGTTAAISVCGPGNFCSGTGAITLTVTALVPSVGALTATPSPVSTTGTTVLSAQFKRDPANTTLPAAGVPSGQVTFTAAGNTVGTATLTLDKTATFTPITTATQVATTATPVISPPTGTYPTAQTITITDAGPNAATFYTLDGSAPSANSTPYTGPFTISTATKVNAVAIANGYLISTVASSVYNIFVPIPTSLAFVQQPSTTAINTPIAPPVTVEVLDQNGNLITNSSALVSINFGADPGDTQLNGTLNENAVNGIATFADLNVANVANGYTLVATSGNLTPATSNKFNITPYPITVQLFNPLIGVTSTLPGTFTLAHPAPQGGVTVSLASDQTGFVTVSPATVNVPAGGTTGSFTYTGVAPGLANISASAPNYLTGSSSVTATNSLVSLGTIQPVAPGQTVSLALSIGTNAPAGGVTVNFTSSNPAVATVTSSVFIPAGQRTAAANPQIVGVSIGTTTINATAQGYAPDTRTVNVTVVATFSPTSVTVNLATSNTTTLNISAPAQAGGLTFTLKSDDPTKVSVASSVTVAAGQTSVPVPITGVTDGTNTIIRADSPGVTEATLPVNVSAHLSISSGITGVNLEVGASVSIPVTSPSPITVTITSTDPTTVLLSKSQTVVGQASITYTNITTNSIPTFYVQGQKTGATTLTVSAPGYTNGTTTATVYPSGFSFLGYNSSGLATTTFSAPTAFNVYPTILNPSTLTQYTNATVSPGLGPISINVTSSNTAVGTISTSPVVFNGGDTYQQTTFQPSMTGGTTSVSLSTPTTPAGFSTPAQYTQFTATVSAPVLNISAAISGVNLEVGGGVSIPVNPPAPVTVTITSTDPTVALLSKSLTTVGQASITYTNISTNSIPTFYIQGQKAGATTLTVSAPGYTNGTTTATVYPSGFSFLGYNNGGLATTTFSAPTALNVYPTILNPSTLTQYTNATVSPGLAPIMVNVTSSNTAVGTISTSPVVFNGGDTFQQTTFQPSMTGGTTNVSLSTPTTPAGFSTPAQYIQFTATVSAPILNISASISGVNLEVGGNVSIPVNPPNPVSVTITSTDPTVALLSKSLTTVGQASITYTNVSNNSIPTFYIQGQKAGATTLTVSAPGYTNGTTTAIVYPSGFSFLGYNNNGLPTTTFSAPTQIGVYPTILNPTTLTQYTNATVSPGFAPIMVNVTSSNTVVGTISTSPVIFNGGDNFQGTNFQPASAGMTTVSLTEPTTPPGFSMPAQYTQFVATVSAPTLTISDVITGANMEVGTNVSLPVTPPNPVTVTVTSNGPAITTISKSGTVVGGTTLTFTNVTTAGSLPTIYVQGQATGSTTLTATAAGYSNGTGHVTVYPSGFTFAGNNNSGLTTTTTASPTQLTVYPTVLNPNTFTYYTTGTLNPGLGGVNVPVTSSNTAVGTITISPLVFMDVSTSLNTAFKPAATGTTTIMIGVPANFSTPSQYVQFPATVQ